MYAQGNYYYAYAVYLVRHPRPRRSASVPQRTVLERFQ